jgi:hypothetical protein
MDLGWAISKARGMSQAETARHALYSRLESVLGSEHAETLMTFLPAYSGSEVATRGDIDLLKADFDRLEATVSARFDKMDDVFREHQRFYVTTLIGGMTGLTAIFSIIVSVVVLVLD